MGLAAAKAEAARLRRAAAAQQQRADGQAGDRDALAAEQAARQASLDLHIEAPARAANGFPAILLWVCTSGVETALNMAKKCRSLPASQAAEAGLAGAKAAMAAKADLVKDLRARVSCVQGSEDFCLSLPCTLVATKSRLSALPRMTMRHFATRHHTRHT